MVVTRTRSLIAAAAAVIVALAGAAGGERASGRDPAGARALRHQLAKERARWEQERRELRRAVLERPAVSEALTVASVAYGVPRSRLEAVALCESTLRPGARNGRYRGLFQMGPLFESTPYGRAGLSVWSPYASALAAAYVVSSSGWGPWECA